MTDNRQPVKGFVFAIVAALIWGFSGNFGQFLFEQRNISFQWLVTLRLLCAGSMILIFALLQKNKDVWNIWKNKRDRTDLILFSFLGAFAVQFTFFAAIKHSNSATATVLQYAGPVFIAIYLAFVTKIKPEPKEYAAIFLAIIGTFLLVTHGSFASLSISPAALFWGLLSALSLAYYTVKPVNILRKYSSHIVIGWGMLLGGVAACFIHPVWQTGGQWDGLTWLFVIFIVIFGSIISFNLYLLAVKMIGAQKTSLLASAEPLAATIVAVVWLKVAFLFMDWLGTICIVATILLLTTKRMVPKRKSIQPTGK